MPAVPAPVERVFLFKLTFKIHATRFLLKAGFLCLEPYIFLFKMKRRLKLQYYAQVIPLFSEERTSNEYIASDGPFDAPKIKIPRFNGGLFMQ